MAHVVVMPVSGQTMEEGSVQEWLKTEGDAVQKGEPLLTIMTDKATLEIESEYAGVLRKILVKPEDGEVACLTPIAIIGGPGEIIDIDKVLTEFESSN